MQHKQSCLECRYSEVCVVRHNIEHALQPEFFDQYGRYAPDKQAGIFRAIGLACIKFKERLG